MHYGIMGEDSSDVYTLKVLIKRLTDDYSLKSPRFSTKGYSGWSQMFENGVGQLRLFGNLQCHRVIICFDADGDHDKAAIRKTKIVNELITPANISFQYCALVPVQEIEAWILADLDAVKRIVQSIVLPKPFPSPERVDSPKERLMKISRCPKTRKARYVPAQHNEQAAEHLHLKTVEDKCPAFSEFVTFVTGKTRDERFARRRRKR